MRTQTDRRCTVQTHGLLRRTERDVDRPPTGSALGRQNHRQVYDRIFAIPPYIRPRCSTPDRAGELNMKYRQLDPRNRQYGIADSG
jgi:hypothetical protein